MIWNYKCPVCKIWGCVEWKDIRNSFICYNCKTLHIPPNPENQFEAFVNTQKWPSEIETVVTNIKGKKCTVPGCKKKYEILDHRLAFSKGGKTSVNNLYPMCEEHNQIKGDKDFGTWLRE